MDNKARKRHATAAMIAACMVFITACGKDADEPDYTMGDDGYLYGRSMTGDRGIEKLALRVSDAQDGSPEPSAADGDVPVAVPAYVPGFDEVAAMIDEYGADGLEGSLIPVQYHTEGGGLYLLAGDGAGADGCDVSGHDHRLQWIGQEPSCGEEGQWAYACTGCGHALMTGTAMAPGHDVHPVTVQEGSCHEYHIDSYVCSRCGEEAYRDGYYTDSHTWETVTELVYEDGTYIEETYTWCPYCGKLWEEDE